MKILVLGSKSYVNWLDQRIEFLSENINNVRKAHLIVFTGGADVSPSIYAHPCHHTTYSDILRDDYEIEFYMEALLHNIPMLGICRGNQFLCAMQPKGYIIQNVFNHACYGTHKIEFNNGELFDITSTHHQMIYPFDIENYELLAWSSPSKSTIYEFGDYSLEQLPGDREPEVVFYPDTKCFGIQGHPECMNINSPVIKKLNELIKIKLFNENIL